MESSCVVVALIENYSSSKPLKFSPEKSQILSCDSLVANERYGLYSMVISTPSIGMPFQSEIHIRSARLSGFVYVCCEQHSIKIFPLLVNVLIELILIN